MSDQDSETPSPGSEIPPEVTGHDIEKIPMFVAIQRMTVAERMQFARRADKEGRGLLIRDSNKVVAQAALANPKITLPEIEQCAKSKQLNSDLLREIANNIDWMKNYSVVHALANNPKTPTPLAIKMLPRLKTKDLVLMGKDRNVPAVVRTIAKRISMARQPG